MGTPVSRDSVAEAIRKIFATGKFSDVFVYEVRSTSGIELILNVTENPRLADIRFDGLDKIKQEVLERGWSDKKQAFVQHYDSDAMDASNLLKPALARGESVGKVDDKYVLDTVYEKAQRTLVKARGFSLIR